MSKITRRDFLGITAATAASIVLPASAAPDSRIIGRPLVRPAKGLNPMRAGFSCFSWEIEATGSGDPRRGYVHRTGSYVFHTSLEQASYIRKHLTEGLPVNLAHEIGEDEYWHGIAYITAFYIKVTPGGPGMEIEVQVRFPDAWKISTAEELAGEIFDWTGTERMGS